MWILCNTKRSAPDVEINLLIFRQIFESRPRHRPHQRNSVLEKSQQSHNHGLIKEGESPYGDKKYILESPGFPDHLGFPVVQGRPEEVLEESQPPPRHLPPLPLSQSLGLAVEAEAGAVHHQGEEERLPGGRAEHSQGAEVSQRLQEVEKLSYFSLTLQPPV